MLDNRDYMRRDHPSSGGGGGLRNFSNWTVVTWIIAANLLVFVLQNFVFLETPPFRVLKGGTWVPGFGLSVVGLQAGEVWTVITHMFVHSGFERNGLAFLHIVLNLAMIFIFGRRVLEELGTRNFLIIYFFGGICGAALQLLIVSNTYLIGASGAATALLLAFTSLAPEQRLTVFIPLPIELRARTMGRAVMIISAVLAVFTLLSSKGPQGSVQGVAHLTHLGGALFGFFFVRRLGYSDGSLTSQDLGRMRGRSEKKNPFRRKSRPAPKNREERDAMNRYDSILDKVSDHGIHSLTKEERAILDEVSNRLRAREEKNP